MQQLPIVGMDVTISPSLSLYKMVVFPEASRPNIRILISHFVRNLFASLDMIAPMPLYQQKMDQLGLKFSNKTSATEKYWKRKKMVCFINMKTYVRDKLKEKHRKKDTSCIQSKHQMGHCWVERERRINSDLRGEAQIIYLYCIVQLHQYLPSYGNPHKKFWCTRQPKFFWLL